MGRSALLLVLALGMVFAIIGNNLRKSGTMATEVQTGYHKYASARNLARTAVHSRLRAIDRGESLTGRIDGTFGNGIFYTIVDTITADTLRMISWAKFQDSIYTMKLKLHRFPKPFPPINAAVGLRATPVQFRMTGSSLIDGRDYNSSGNLTGKPGLPGVTVMQSSDSTTVMNNGGSTRITGVPVKTKVDTTIANPREYIDEYTTAPDFKYTDADSPINSNLTWGSKQDPKIVYATTRGDTTKSVKFNGNCVGWGVLVVDGNLELAGTFRWYGVVIVAGENNVINVTASTGTPEILGGLIMAGGPNSSFEMKGNVAMKYSSETLRDAKWTKKLLAYGIDEWYE